MKLATRISNAIKAFSGSPSVSGQRFYGGAALNRITNDWLTLTTSADAEARGDVVKLRARCRQLERDDPYTQRYLKLIENNVLGSTGIKLQMKIRDPNQTFDRVANNKIEEAWLKWCEKANCGVTGQLTLHEISRIVLRAAARDGGILLRKVRGFNNPFKFAIQILEIDFLDVYYNIPISQNGNEIRMGVELNEWKKPVAYWLWTRHPGDYYANGGFKRERIPAEELLHIYRPDRTLQTVGVPWLAPSMFRLKMLEGMEEAALVAYRAAACQGGWFKKQNPEGFVGTDQGDGSVEREAEPGMWTELPVGVEPIQNNPQYPGTSYSEYVKSALRGVSSGLGVSYNSLANDLEGVNYSSIRAGVLEDREEFKQIQNWMVDSFFRPIFREWLQMAILSGQIQLPFTKLDKFTADTWVPRRWGWVDPMKDVQAKILAIDNLLESRRSTIAETGDDIEDIFEELKEDAALQTEYGLEIVRPNQPQAAAEPDGDEEDPAEEADEPDEMPPGKLTSPGL